MVTGDAAKALRMAKYVKSLVNVEYKAIISTFAVDPNTTGAVQSLSGAAQGDDFTARNGRSIKPTSINIQGNVTLHASATASHLRLCVVRDRSGTTTQPAITDMFADVASFLDNRLKNQDTNTASRFDVIMDKMVYINSDRPEAKISFYRKLKKGKTTFTGTAGSDEGRNMYYLFIASSEATNDPVLNCGCTIKFIDN